MIHVSNPPSDLLQAAWVFVSVPVFSGAVLEPELTATLCLNTISPPSHPEIVINTTPLKIGDWTTRKLLRDPN